MYLVLPQPPCPSQTQNRPFYFFISSRGPQPFLFSLHFILFYMHPRKVRGEKSAPPDEAEGQRSSFYFWPLVFFPFSPPRGEHTCCFFSFLFK
ncbi:unnamed protein product [Amoebophrya sp. A120]|nr:unnamed protein product [Amoebophrya sp. A120]|eukprot:GSA120T00003193001.1